MILRGGRTGLGEVIDVGVGATVAFAVVAAVVVETAGADNAAADVNGEEESDVFDEDVLFVFVTDPKENRDLKLVRGISGLATAIAADEKELESMNVWMQRL